MYKIIFTRFCNHLYYQTAFIKYHLDIFDEIYVLCHNDDYEIIRKNLAIYDKVNVVPNLEHRHISNYFEGLACKKIFQFALSVASKRFEYGEVLLYFPDDDEFIEWNESILQVGINRTVFYEWYLPPDLRQEPISIAQFLEQINKGQCHGRILNMWGNPFFKDNLLLLNPINIDAFMNYYMTTGFHRVVEKNHKSVVLDNRIHHHIVNHLKGIPKLDLQERVKMKLDLIENKNDIDYINCSKQFNRLYNDFAYAEWYKQLVSKEKMKQNYEVLKKAYDIDMSSENKFPIFFN